MSDLEHALHHLKHASRRRDIWPIMRDYFKKLGVVMASYHTTGRDGLPLNIVTEGFPENWVKKYVEQNLIDIDPAPGLAAKMPEPFLWHDIEDLVPSTDDTNSFLRMMKEANVGDGVSLYVFGPAMQNAYVALGFGTDRIELSSESLLAIQSVAQAGHLRYCSISRAKAEKSALTRRETEVLHWVAKGKSNSVIANILEVSQHTIDAHMGSVANFLEYGRACSHVVNAPL